MQIPPEIEDLLHRDSQIFSDAYSLMKNMQDVIESQKLEIEERGKLLAQVLIDIGNGQVDAAETRLEEFFEPQKVTVN